MEHYIKLIYVYFTDFLFNLSHLIGYSYYEINFIVFCIIFPLLSLFLPITYLYLNYKLSKKKAH